MLYIIEGNFLNEKTMHDDTLDNLRYSNEMKNTFHLGFLYLCAAIYFYKFGMKTDRRSWYQDEIMKMLTCFVLNVLKLVAFRQFTETKKINVIF